MSLRIGGEGTTHTVDVGPGGMTLGSLDLINSGDGFNEFTIIGDIRAEGALFGSAGSRSQLNTFRLTSGSLTLRNSDFQRGFNVNFSALLILEDGYVIDATNVNSYSQGSGFVVEEGSARIIRPAEAIAFTDDAGRPDDSVLIGSDIFVTLFDDDEATSGAQQDTTFVTVTSLVTGDAETLELTQTDDRSEEFRNTSALLALSGTANPGDGILQTTNGENLRVEYTDPQDPSDMISRELFVNPATWDGGGADNDWTTPENWSTDQVPTRLDQRRTARRVGHRRL